ncbi:hypothetical protein [Roseovarius sp. SYSU LYC5161]|uniref:hypothetical protein n=1 Tax=Roseovarius halophilus (ex Wu et al. 2025) TaxID=3376060 RepID=UPI00399B2224
MTDIKLTKGGTHYFHLLLKTYSGSKKSARLNWRQARQAANYQMLVVANDKEMIKTYGILIATGFITATAFYGHAASLDIVLGLLIRSLLDLCGLPGSSRVERALHFVRPVGASGA